MDYNNGKIYGITRANCRDIYIGYTTLSLDELNVDDIDNPVLIKIISNGNYNINLIKEYPCDTEEEIMQHTNEVKEMVSGYFTDLKSIEQVPCECGVSIKEESLPRHLKTDKHMNNLIFKFLNEL